MADPIQFPALPSLESLERGRLSPTEAPQATGDQDESFSDMLSGAIRSVDETMKESDQATADFVAGKTENVHDVMIAMQRSQVSFQMMVEIRNKVLDAYHEISRMQI
ncbi:MAG: flagellar hook-basal body complex protein FliE [Balneolaceae bacterium]